MPEIENADLARTLCPIINGALQAFQPLGPGKLGIDVPHGEH